MSVKKVKNEKMHVTQGAYTVRGAMKRWKVPACLRISWPLPTSHFLHNSKEACTEPTLESPHLLCLQTVLPKTMALVLLNHAPLVHTSVFSPCFIQWLRDLLSLNEASFGSESCTLTKMTEDVWTQHLRSAALVVQWAAARWPQRVKCSDGVLYHKFG